jgi:hypothetical protein
LNIMDLKYHMVGVGGSHCVALSMVIELSQPV